jgi:hypothetical protein
MPDDVEIHVGQQHSWTLPKPFIEASEKYGGQTRLVKQPDGRYRLDNYVAGYPFPKPDGPDKGTEIAANITYRFQGYLEPFPLKRVMRARSTQRIGLATTTRKLSMPSTGNSRTTGNQMKVCHGSIQKLPEHGTRNI